MIHLGKFNTLTIARKSEFGIYLADDEQKEVLLPRRFVPDTFELGDQLSVFVYLDSENRLTATTQKPVAQVGEFASFKVVSNESAGAFLDWGLAKDLFLPFSEQTRKLRIGDFVIAYVYVDNTDRLAASMRLDRNLPNSVEGLSENQEVEILVAAKTDLGYKSIIQNNVWGILYFNEVFKDLPLGTKTKAFIKKLRPDGKIDLSLQRIGHQAADDIAPLILQKLKDNKGYLEINDKTSAELIYDLFGVSKKKYKMALGSLYKQRLITVSDDGIRLV